MTEMIKMAGLPNLPKTVVGGISEEINHVGPKKLCPGPLPVTDKADPVSKWVETVDNVYGLACMLRPIGCNNQVS